MVTHEWPIISSLARNELPLFSRWMEEEEKRGRSGGKKNKKMDIDVLSFFLLNTQENHISYIKKR